MANKREKVVSGRASGASGTRPVGRTEGYARVSDAGTGSSAGSWNREQNPNGSWNRDKNPKAPVRHQSGSAPVKKNPKTTPAAGNSGAGKPVRMDATRPTNTAESIANRLSNISGQGGSAANKSKYAHDTQEGRALPMNAAGSKKLKR